VLAAGITFGITDKVDCCDWLDTESTDFISWQYKGAEQTSPALQQHIGQRLMEEIIRQQDVLSSVNNLVRSKSGAGQAATATVDSVMVFNCKRPSRMKGALEYTQPRTRLQT
jgi:hypothetical protein